MEDVRPSRDGLRVGVDVVWDHSDHVYHTLATPSPSLDGLQ